ncbi:MAG: MFS transporter [Pseudomonadales bacterium]
MFYGWFIVASAFLTLMVSTGFYTYSFGLLVLPLEQEFGVSRADIMLGPTLAAMAGLLISPIVGQLVDKWSVRWILSIGSLIMSAAMLLLSLATSINQFIAIFGVMMCLAMATTGPIPNNTVVSRWFSNNRGKALGFAALGTSIGGMAIPLLMTWWLDAFGWRITLQLLALTNLVLVFPAVFFLVRDNPQMKGLLPDGIKPLDHDGNTPPPPQPNLSNKDILKKSSFWLVGSCLGFLFMVYSATMTNLPPMAIGLGIEATQAAGLITVVAICGLLGKLVFGYAADVISLRVGLWLAIGLAGIGIAIFATEPGYPMLVAGSMAIGFAAGGMLPVWGNLMAALFGTISYGRAMGLMTPLTGLFVMPGYFLAGVIYDQTGGYTWAMYLFLSFLLIAACLLIPLKMPQRQ